jgi:hypothetical protein
MLAYKKFPQTLALLQREASSFHPTDTVTKHNFRKHAKIKQPNTPLMRNLPRQTADRCSSVCDRGLIGITYKVNAVEGKVRRKGSGGGRRSETSDGKEQEKRYLF